MRGAAATLLRACLVLPALATSGRAQAVLDAAPASTAGAAATSAPGRGVRVRVVLADSAVQLRRALFVRRLPPQEGRLVRVDDDAVTVRLAAGRELHLPASSVHRLEVRTGPGYCRASGPALASCVVAGAVAGALVQGAIESAMHVRTRRTGLRGVGIGLVFAFTVARDRWAPMPGWPSE